MLVYTVSDILDILDTVHIGGGRESGNEMASALNTYLMWDVFVMIEFYIILVSTYYNQRETRGTVGSYRIHFN